MKRTRPAQSCGLCHRRFRKVGQWQPWQCRRPRETGFDVFFGYYDQSHAHSYYPPYLIRNRREVPQPGNQPGLQLTGRTYSHYEILRESKQWIRENKDRPFFAYLAWTPPHGSFAIPAADPSFQLYKDKPWPAEAKVYAAMVNMIDRHFGQVLEMLKDLGLDDNTLVMFSGDNGWSFDPQSQIGKLFDQTMGGKLRGFKRTMYEGGLRQASFAWWPGTA